MGNEIKIIFERLNEAYQKSGKTYVELEKITGISKSALQRYINGSTRKVPIDVIQAIASATGVSAAWIMGWDDSENGKYLSPIITADTVTFPVLGEIAAGYDQIAIEDWSGETVEIPVAYLKGREKSEFFVLTVKGNSMYPHYQDGDKVLILRQSTVNRSGDIGAVIYEDECATLKKIEFTPGEDEIRLVPINPEYIPKEIKGADLERCRVLGIPYLLIRECIKY